MAVYVKKVNFYKKILTIFVKKENNMGENMQEMEEKQQPCNLYSYTKQSYSYRRMKVV